MSSRVEPGAAVAVMPWPCPDGYTAEVVHVQASIQRLAAGDARAKKVRPEQSISWTGEVIHVHSVETGGGGMFPIGMLCTLHCYVSCCNCTGGWCRTSLPALQSALLHIMMHLHRRRALCCLPALQTALLPISLQLAARVSFPPYCAICVATHGIALHQAVDAASASCSATCTAAHHVAVWRVAVVKLA